MDIKIVVGTREELMNGDCILDADPVTNTGALWLGNYHAAQCLEFLQERKITHVVSILTYKNYELVSKYESLGITHKLFFASDRGTEDIFAY